MRVLEKLLAYSWFPMGERPCEENAWKEVVYIG